MKARRPTWPELAAAIDEAAAAARRSGVRIALTGGCALWAHGSNRRPADVDLIVERPFSGLPVAHPIPHGVRVIARNGVPIDLVTRDPAHAELFDQALATARRIPGIPMPVVDLPHLVAIKILSRSRHLHKDERDLDFILLDAAVDWHDVRRVLADHLGPLAAAEVHVLERIHQNDRGRQGPRSSADLPLRSSTRSRQR
jgi:hypothetical protein